MLTYDDLNQQNDRITELSNVLHYLLSDRGMCDTQVTCDLFFDFVDRVNEHLAIEDKYVFSKLLKGNDQKAINTAHNFMSGGMEIKRLFSSYLKKWCALRGKELRIKDYSKFSKETSDMMDLILTRMQNESEHLFPTLRAVTGDNHRIA